MVTPQRTSSAECPDVPPVADAVTAGRSVWASLRRLADAGLASPLWVFFSYAAIACWILRGWLADAAGALPTEDFPADAALIVQILGWVGHALTHNPLHLFDAPINHPALGQLSSSEHFLSAQVLFLPLTWATGNPVLAANLTALALWPLTALVMSRLLVALGLRPGACWLGGLLFAAGQGRAALSLHVLQLPQVYIALCALLAHRLRERATVGRCVALAVGVGAGLLSSYYLAVTLVLALAVWLPYELLRKGDGRARYAELVAIAVAVPLALLVVVSLPYLGRPEARGEVELAGTSRWGVAHLIAAPSLVVEEGSLAGAGRPHRRDADATASEGGGREGQRRQSAASGLFSLLIVSLTGGPLLLTQRVLALGGAIRCLRCGARDAPATVVALLIAILGGLLVLGPRMEVLGVEIPLPFAWLQATPARFVRVPTRFAMLINFGCALLAAFAIDGLLRRDERRRAILTMAASSGALALGSMVVVLMAAKAGITSWGALRWVGGIASGGAQGPWMRSVRAVAADRPVYRAVAARVRERGAGPLLELPFFEVQGEAMIATAMHHLPAISSYSGYEPPHRGLINGLIRELPWLPALDDLRDLTGLRWILVRPESEWGNPAVRARMIDVLLRYAGTRSAVRLGEFVLVELEAGRFHRHWYAALAAGPRPGVTLLGTPLEAIPEEAAQARLATWGEATTWVRWLARVPLKITNMGAHGWPASAPPGVEDPPLVHLETRWLDARGEPVGPPGTMPLRRDVPAGESLLQSVLAVAPSEPGAYFLEMRVRQRNGARFEGPENEPLRVRVRVILPPESSSQPDLPAARSDDVGRWAAAPGH